MFPGRKIERGALPTMHPLSGFAWLVTITALVAVLLSGCATDPSIPQAQAAPITIRATDSPVDPGKAATVFYPNTPTPYRPLAPTAIISFDPSATPIPTQPEQSIVLVPMPGWQVELPPAAGENASVENAAAGSSVQDASPEPTLDFYGIDFSSHQRVTIEIIPPDAQVNKGKPIKISFVPGERCEFGDRKACVYAYKPTVSGNVIVLTIHSGVGGEGQKFRSALEGTGINRAAFSLDKVQENMASLAGATVVISQDERVVESTQMQAVTRIPARSLTRYFHAALSEILRVAADLNPEISHLVNPELPQIVLETCGWKMPGEEGSARVSDTTGSVYLGIIR